MQFYEKAYALCILRNESIKSLMLTTSRILADSQSVHPQQHTVRHRRSFLFSVLSTLHSVADRQTCCTDSDAESVTQGVCLQAYTDPADSSIADHPEPGAAAHILAHVDRDAYQPRPCGTVAPERIQVSVCLQKRFLHRILGKGNVLQISAAQAEQVLLVMQNQPTDDFFRVVRARDNSHCINLLSTHLTEEGTILFRCRCEIHVKKAAPARNDRNC